LFTTAAEEDRCCSRTGKENSAHQKYWEKPTAGKVAPCRIDSKPAEKKMSLPDALFGKDGSGGAPEQRNGAAEKHQALQTWSLWQAFPIAFSNKDPRKERMVLISPGHSRWLCWRKAPLLCCKSKAGKPSGQKVSGLTACCKQNDSTASSEEGFDPL